MIKKYIVYRHYNEMIYWTYERVELSEAELTPYIKAHLGELNNIEIFTKESRIKLDLNINLEVQNVRN